MTENPSKKIITQNAAMLSPEKIDDVLLEKSGIIKNNIISLTLNILVHKGTGKIKKIGRRLHDSEDPNMINVYVTTDREFPKTGDHTTLLKLKLDDPNDLSSDAKAILVKSLKEAVLQGE